MSSDKQGFYFADSGNRHLVAIQQDGEIPIAFGLGQANAMRIAEALNTHPASDVSAVVEDLRGYTNTRRLELDSEIRSEMIGGNAFKEGCARAALAEIAILECEIQRAHDAQDKPATPNAISLSDADYLANQAEYDAMDEKDKP